MFLENERTFVWHKNLSIYSFSKNAQIINSFVIMALAMIPGKKIIFT